MSTGSLVFAFFAMTAVAVAAAWFLLRGGSRGGSNAKIPMNAWTMKAMRPLTPSELKAFALIRKALPECLVLPQVALARFMTVGQSKSYSQWFNSIGRRTVDFLVCSDQGDVLGVIQLRTHRTERLSEGSRRKHEALELAHVPVWMLANDDLPDVQKLRSLVIPELQSSQQHSLQQPEADWEATRQQPQREPEMPIRKPEALASKPSRWNQAWPTEEARSSDFLDEAGMIEIPRLVVKGHGRTATGFTRD